MYDDKRWIFTETYCRRFSSNRNGIQGAFDDEFSDTFNALPPTPPRAPSSYNPPNVFSQGHPATNIGGDPPQFNPTLPKHTVYVNPPTTSTYKPPIVRPPPKHPGVQIPGVQHPQNSGSIQDIIQSFDTKRRYYQSNGQSNANTNQYQESTINTHGYPGFRPPIGYDKIPPYTTPSPPPTITYPTPPPKPYHPPPTQKPYDYNYQPQRPQQSVVIANQDANNFYHPKVEVKKPYHDKNYYEVHLKDLVPKAPSPPNNQYPASPPSYPPQNQYVQNTQGYQPPSNTNFPSPNFQNPPTQRPPLYPTNPSYVPNQPQPSPVIPPVQHNQNTIPYGGSRLDYNTPPPRPSVPPTSNFFNEVNKMEPIVLNENGHDRPSVIDNYNNRNDYATYSLTTTPRPSYETRPPHTSHNNLNSLVNSYSSAGSQVQPYGNPYTYTKPPKVKYGSGMPTGTI